VLVTKSATALRALPGTRSGVALVDDTGATEWAVLDDVLQRAVGAMQATAEPGQRWAVLGENAAATMVAHAAGLIGGTGTAAIARQLTAGEMAYQFRDAGVVAAVASVELAPVVADASRQAGVGLVVVHGTGDLPADPPVPVVRWADWLATAPEAEPASNRPAAPMLVYTSGTTGRARASIVRWAFGEFASAAEYLEALTAGAHTPDGTHLVAGPLQHNGPLTAVRHLLSGGRVVVLGKFDAERALAAIDRHRVSSSVMVPTHLQRLLALPDGVKELYDVSSMRLLAHTGSACPPAVKRAMIEWFGPVLVESYGGSEVGTLCRIDSTEWLTHQGSVGRAAAPYEVSVRGGDGVELPVGEPGLLCFRVPDGRGIQYLNDPEKTAAAYVEPGLITLGDIGRVDADGYVFVTDRAADMVVSGGVNLYPAECEQVLISHPAVADVAVIGVPHEDLGEQLLALVVPADAAAPPAFDELGVWCRERLAPYKVPKRYELVGNLPRNAMTKLDKRALRRPYWPDDRTVAG
jgi:acyl-CoA synthetase (AMP-forming)/AMP-acid ligase II